MPELPTTFGKYYLTEKLATGGMAEIYLAKIIGPGGFEKSLVIKQIHPKLSGQRHFVDLFVAEAKRLVTLAHGNIVPVYELGVVDDTYFIAMDYIDGPTLYRLTEIMARRDAKMEPQIAAWITTRILDGLDYAHRKGEGVIHRDLSPRNVMLSRDGEVKLVDFGIAVTLGDPGENEAHQSAPTGSFPYMSPEQVRRESLTPATDLFTVGVLFWEMLVGQRLFARHDAQETLDAVLQEPIPKPSSRRMDVPSKLDELVMRALERDQGARWANAGEMRDAINRYLYSMTGAPSSQDVAALVAKYCPPETRRLPTHAEAAAPHAVDEEERSAPIDVRSNVTYDSGPPAGPSTAVIPRDGSQPRGKRPQRHQTFATHVELKSMLERAQSQAEPDDEPVNGEARAPATVVSPRRTAEQAAVRSSEPRIGEISTDERSDPTPLPAPVPHRPSRAITERPDVVESDGARTLAEPPSRRALFVLGIGAIALALAAVYIFYLKRDGVLLYEDAGAKRDAPNVVVPTAIDALVDGTPADASEPDGPPADASPPDAGKREPRDGGAAITRVDAGATRDANLVGRPDAIASAGGTATLTLGADPWAKVYIDGVLQKDRAPHEFTVSAGHHEVRLVFDAETPAQEKPYSIDIKAGETQSFTAVFH